MKELAISFVIPTYNSQIYIDNCINSILVQKSLEKISYEILIIDGGSTDNTISKLNKYQNLKILNNPLKTGEAGKFIGIKNSKYENICLIDSDNLIDKNYIYESLSYLKKDNNISGVEPIKFGYMPNMGIIDKYCSLTGVNDPINLYLGNFDKTSVFFKNKWTDKSYENIYEDNKMIKFKIDHLDLPTIGANGSIFKRSDLNKFLDQQNFSYFFDVDYLIFLQKKYGSIIFIKIKLPVYHYYCGSNFFKFYKKQKRRINDFFKFEEFRLYNPKKQKKAIFLFIFETIFFISFIKSIYFSFKTKQPVLLIHSFLSFLTLFVYSTYFIKRKKN